MAITSPEIHLGESDKELLVLLGGLLTGASLAQPSNHSSDEVPLSDCEAARLIELLEELIVSRRFIESTSFVEELSRGENANLKGARKIFTEWRTKTGRNKSMSWLHWNEFLHRFSCRIDQKTTTVVSKSGEMTFSYFLKMERILLKEISVNPRVASIVMHFVSKYQSEVEAARCGDAPMLAGSIIAQPKALLDALKKSVGNGIGVPAFSTQRLVGIITVVANTSVLFTTRDWSVAGTFSTIAGAMAASGSD